MTQPTAGLTSGPAAGPTSGPALDAELAELRAMLSNDGFGLQPLARAGDTVDLAITVVSDDACSDCLVPKPMMRTLITAKLAPSGLALGELTYPTEFPGDA